GLGNVWNDGIRVPDVGRHFENRRDGARAADVAHLHEAVVTHLVKLAAEAVGFTRCFDRIQPFSYRRITRRMHLYCEARGVEVDERGFQYVRWYHQQALSPGF